MHTVRVWDLPTRLFHWSLVACVIGLVITGNLGGNWMNWHFRFGYAVLTLLLFRLGWGFLGGHWSRFASFVRGPSAILHYLKDQASPLHSVGHNPLGALSVLAMLLVLLAQVTSGMFADDEISFYGPLTGLASGDIISLATWYHKAVGKLLILALVALHVLAILYYRLVRKQALTSAMVHGDRRVDASGSALPTSADGGRQRTLALVLLAMCAAATWALVTWGYAQGGGL